MEKSANNEKKNEEKKEKKEEKKTEGKKWEEAASCDDVKEGLPLSVKVGNRNIVFIRRGDKIYASGAKCPHYGAPLGEGVLIDHVLTCPWHTARFDVTSGMMVSPPALDDLSRFEVKIRKGKVYVKKTEKPPFRIQVKREKGTFVIIGGGAAGFSAAFTLRKEGFDGRVIIATAESEAPYDRPNLSKDYLSGELEAKWMPLKSPEFYREMCIELLTNYRLILIDRKNRALHFTGGLYLEYDKLLLATGAIPKTPDIPGHDLKNFFLLRSLSDANAIISTLDNVKDVVVLGASFLGLEVASSLRNWDLNVHIVAPESIPMARIFGPEIGELLLKTHISKGVQFHLGVTPERIKGDDRVREVVLSNRKKVHTDVVIAGIGVVPAVTCVSDTDLLENNSVVVDSTLKTRDDNIYAAGDIALVPDHITGKGRRIEHWVEAQRQGQHAARAMLGSNEPYREVPFFWTKQYDKVLKYVGYSKGYDRLVYRGNVESGNFLAGYYTKGQGEGSPLELRAAASMGRSDEIIIVSELLKAGISVPPEVFQDESSDLREFFEKKRVGG